MNTDSALLRVALRQQVMPRLADVVPGFVAQAARSAELLREAADLLAEFAQDDLRGAGLADGVAPALSSNALRRLSLARQALLVRAWFAELGCAMPSRARLGAWLAQMVGARSAHAQCRHDGWVFVRYRERIEAYRQDARPGPLAPAPDPVVLHWRGESELTVPAWCLRLRIERVAAGGDRMEAAVLPREGRLQIRAGCARDRVRVPGAAMSRSLKNLWQEQGVPPWLRPWLPCLFWEGSAVPASLRIVCEALSGDDPRGPWLNRW